MIEYFINQSYDKRKVKVTYLLYLRVVLVLTMVRFRLHHLRHHWSQISIFVLFFLITFITILISKVHTFTFKCSTFYTIIQ